jgi:hypothetical protein
MEVKPIERSCNQADAWIGQTLLVRRWEEMKNEILLYKWYESEKAGHDIGWERASIQWMARFGCRDQRRS